jgi:hypothetical protein
LLLVAVAFLFLGNVKKNIISECLDIGAVYFLHLGVLAEVFYTEGGCSKLYSVDISIGHGNAIKNFVKILVGIKCRTTFASLYKRGGNN